MKQKSQTRQTGAAKAVIATARKLLKIIFDALVNGGGGEDFTTFTLVENQIAAGYSS